jgi:hypothetical protein
MCFQANGQSKFTALIEHEIGQLRDSDSGNSFRLSLYNDSNSVLCILTSVAGTYRRGVPETLFFTHPEQDSVTYKFDHLAADTLVNTYLPTRRQICVLPFQTKIVDLLIPKRIARSFLELSYYHSDSYTYSVNKTEKYKPMWFKKFNIKSLAIELLPKQ